MSTVTKYTNLDYLHLMADGDQEMVRTMIEMLLVELPEELSQIKQLHQEENWPELSRVSHKMKSTLVFVGNEEMINANKEIEQLSKQNLDLHRLRGLVEILEYNLSPVMNELRQYL